MSNTHLHSFLRSASVAFLFMGGTVLWGTNAQMILAKAGVGETVLMQQASEERLVQGSLHPAPLPPFLVPEDALATQILLGTLFFFAGFFLYVLLLQQTGAVLRFPFGRPVRHRTRHLRRVFGTWLDRDMYPRAHRR